MKIAILDDYHDVARRYADWTSLGGDSEVRIFNSHIPDAQVEAELADFDVIVAMRERTPFPAARIQALPRLRLLITTGMRNNAIDMAACKARGVTVCGAPGDALAATATAELAWAHILGLFKHLPAEDAAMRRGMWRTAMPSRWPAGAWAWSAWASWSAAVAGRAGLRHGRGGLEPQPER